MKIQDFMIEFEKSCLRSKKTLMKKAEEYASSGEDRLDQFKRQARLTGNNPTQELFSLAAKHITSIADMVRDPNAYSIKVWNEKLGDLRNYTFLLDALIRDMGIE